MSVPSITYWSRLEPRPRAPSIADTLAARVRDPLWLLARQWQFGEFKGEDAGSPSFAQLAVAFGTLDAWTPPQGERRPLPPRSPLEPAALAEDADTGDLALAVELGQVFEQALRDLGRPTLVDLFRQSYAILPGDAPAPDADALRFLDLATGRATHGIRLFLAAKQALPGLPAVPALDPGDEDVVRHALERLRDWVAQTVGNLGSVDAEAWVPDRLEYDLTLDAQDATGAVTLAAHPDHRARFDWHAFDATARGDAPSERPVERIQRSMIPAGATFRGMPSARWWAFESGTTNLAAIRPEKREVAKLIVLDFMLVHGNDWYVLGLDQPLGTLCTIESLVVRDVFGGLTLVERADRTASADGGRWTMFSTAMANGSDVAGFFLMAPTVGPGIQAGDPVEEVRFLRDEMANLAWGVERLVPNALGEPWAGAERSAAVAATQASSGAGGGSPSALRYRIQTTVPEHWIPFLPVVIEPGRRDIMLERGVLLRSVSEPPGGAEPAGRILRPSKLAGAPYRFDEEELPRNGRRVARAMYRSRWLDGRTFVWQARSVTSGTGDERSGLEFDVADPPSA